MIDLRAARHDPEAFRAAVARKGAGEAFDELLAADERWRELIPGAQGEVVSIEGAGHMVPYERPDELADAVVAFLGAPAAVSTP